MNTLNTILPFYDSARKVSDPADSGVKILCPIHKLPAFQFRRDHSTTEWPMLVNLVDTLGNKTNITSYFDLSGELITGWTNDSFNTFTATASDYTIDSAIDSSSGTVEWAYSNAISVTIGNVFKLEFDLALNSGTAPTIYVGDTSPSSKSNSVQLQNGYNVLYLKATATGSYRFIIQSGQAALCNFSGTYSFKKTSFPRIMSYTTYDYIQHNGEALNTMLPAGTYYLEISSAVNPVDSYPALSTSVREYYCSEWMEIIEVNKNLIDSWLNSGYDTYSSSGSTILSAIDAGATPHMIIANNNALITEIKRGDILKFTCFLTLNSGTAPYVKIRNIVGDNMCTPVQLSDGMNEIDLEITQTPNNESAYLYIHQDVSVATNFSTNECGFFRHYSEDYITLEYSNSSDFGTILYQDGFIQEGYFRGFLSRGEGQIERIGDELDGQFIDEKIISRFVHKLKVHVNKFLYRGLQLLRGHDTITITDKDGNQYTPLNVEIEPPNWSGERGLCEIRFTTSEDIFVNSRAEDNIT